MNNIFAQLLSLSKQGEFQLKVMLIGSVTEAALQGIVFFMLIPFLDAFINGDHKTMWLWLFIMAITLCFYSIIHYFSQKAAYRSGVMMGGDLYQTLSKHIVNLPLGWFRRNQVGEVSEMFSKGVINVMGLTAHIVKPIIHAFVTPGVMIVLLFFYHWPLALALLVTTPILYAVYRWAGQLVTNSEHGYHASMAEVDSRMIEFIQQQSLLRAFGQGQRFLRQALIQQHRGLHHLLKTSVPGMIMFSLSIQAVFTLLLVLGSYFVIIGSIDVVKFVVLLILTARFIEPMVSATDLNGGLRVASNSLARMQALMQVERLPEPKIAPPLTNEGLVEFKQVSFAYVSKKVINQVSFTIKPGTLTALVGPSGSGKSTIMQLIARFWDAQEGEISVGGVDIKQLPQATLMNQISWVFQNVYLYDDTIWENIRCGNLTATDEQIKQAATLAQVNSIIQGLPQGWQTQVGEIGSRLSGGERQRIAIARALLKQAPIMLFDEATAALDSENQQAVQNVIQALKGKHTLIVIAHRLETIMQADQIIVLNQKGEIDDIGQHHELIQRHGFYTQFWQDKQQSEGWSLR
ncbi:ABC transporter ATP-binding protein [Orbaceae bacterium ac157xtp]